MVRVGLTGVLLRLQGVKFLGDCEFIAIFDADFKPEPDFLQRTVPYLVIPSLSYLHAAPSDLSVDSLPSVGVTFEHDQIVLDSV